MPQVAPLPDELRRCLVRKKDRYSGAPALVAAFGPTGVVVAAGQRRVDAAVARFDAELGDAAVRVLGTGPDIDYIPYQLRSLTPLPDGRLLLCACGRVAHYLDDRDLSVTPADDLAVVVDPDDNNVSMIDPHPRAAFVLGDRLLLGHGSNFVSRDDFSLFSALPLAGGPPVAWLRDLQERMEKIVLPAGYWYLEGGAVLGDNLLIAGQTVKRSGSRDHGLTRLGGEEGELRQHRPWAKERVLDPLLAMVADPRHAVVLAYFKGGLELLDANLATVAEVNGHPFLVGHRLLAGDGQGRLLWFHGRTGTLVLTGPDELDPTDLAASLDALPAKPPR